MAPITRSGYQKFQWMRLQLEKEGVNNSAAYGELAFEWRPWVALRAASFVPAQSSRNEDRYQKTAFTVFTGEPDKSMARADKSFVKGDMNKAVEQILPPGSGTVGDRCSNAQH